jgi:THO complex subunit 1
LELWRERVIAKNFSSKNLIILQSCNELLRRLSRAEDIAFCGRAFIYLLSRFPLGDKSSVNLRGEYYTENVTSFDVLPSQETEPETMEINEDASTTPPTISLNGAPK